MLSTQLNFSSLRVSKFLANLPNYPLAPEQCLACSTHLTTRYQINAWVHKQHKLWFCKGKDLLYSSPTENCLRFHSAGEFLTGLLHHLLEKTWQFSHLNTWFLWHFYYVWLIGDSLYSNHHFSVVKKWRITIKPSFLIDFHHLLSVSNTESSKWKEYVAN